MPRKPKTPCRHPGCPELVEGSYCKEHQSQRDSHYNRYERDPKSKNRYNSRWQRIRKMYLHRHPMCEQCLERGKTVKAQEVHHILPLGRGGSHRESNLQALCKPCHSRQSVLDGDRFPRGKRYSY